MSKTTKPVARTVNINTIKAAAVANKAATVVVGITAGVAIGAAIGVGNGIKDAVAANGGVVPQWLEALL